MSGEQDQDVEKARKETRLILLVGIGGTFLVLLLGLAAWGWFRPTKVATPSAQIAVAEPSVVAATTEVEEVVRVPEHGDEEPQVQEVHPSLYVETGTEGTRTWKLTASDDEVVIIGGWAVDGADGGVYRAIHGPVEASVTVTDGFALIIVEEWAQNEFCFRIDQAEQYGWAHSTEQPLPIWEPCTD